MADDILTQLALMRVTATNAYMAAQAKNDQAGMDAAYKLMGDIDSAGRNAAMDAYASLAARLATLQAKIADDAQKAKGSPFGSNNDDHEVQYHDVIADNDFEDQGPSAPAPAPAPTPVPSDVVPAVTAAWSEDYLQLWNSMTILPAWQGKADDIATKIIQNQGQYVAAVAGMAVPWWFVAVVHAMECGLNFTEHLHNGDPLTDRTVRYPPGRPPVWRPPSQWADSAKDALIFERLDKVTDWSLPSVLFHWHRYNGINNQYKVLHIPTPYLWSGSQHYVKGKYIADHDFDPNAVSKQVGAAVILKALIQLNAVILNDPSGQLESNAASAAQHVGSLSLNLNRDIASANAELDYFGPLQIGSGKKKVEGLPVRRVQEWLNFHGFPTPIDSSFGQSTAEQLGRFAVKNGRQLTGTLNEDLWALLTAPLRKALAPITVDPSSSLEQAVIKSASQHIAQGPIELGGNNCGPWVRLYMKGNEGPNAKWCAGFVCFIVAQAARDVKVDMPFQRETGVDQLVANAVEGGRFIPEADVTSPAQRRSKIQPGSIFVVRNPDNRNDWTHTGIVLATNDQTFDTLEGNTGGEGGIDGPNARQGNRSYLNRDFVRLL